MGTRDLKLNTNIIARYSDLPDSELVLACQQGNEAAFSVLYKRNLRFVYAALHRLAPDMAQNHEDMSQIVFIRVWKCIPALRNPAAFKSWLNQLITNMFYDEMRKRPKHMLVSLDHFLSNGDAGNDEHGRDIPDSKPQPDEYFEIAQTRVHINEALARLSTPFRNVFILRELYGMTYDEIALCTRSELGTIKSRISRAKSKMQVHLQRANCA